MRNFLILLLSILVISGCSFFQSKVDTVEDSIKKIANSIENNKKEAFLSLTTKNYQERAALLIESFTNLNIRKKVADSFRSAKFVENQEKSDFYREYQSLFPLSDGNSMSEKFIMVKEQDGVWRLDLF